MAGIKGLKSLIESYENVGSGDFVKTGWLKGLKDDGDTITARIMVKGKTGVDEHGEPIYDLPIYEIHNVEIDGWNRDVKCIGEENGCPFCLGGEHPSLKVYIPLYIEGAEVPIQIWKRGLNDIKKLLSLIEEYGDLNARDFKIKRIGKKGNPKTIYEWYPKDREEKELPELPKILGRKSWFLLDLTKEQMQDALDGVFSLKDVDEESEYSESGEPESAF